MPDTTVSELPEKTVLAATDYILIVDNSTNSPTTKRVSGQKLADLMAPLILETVLALS